MIILFCFVLHTQSTSSAGLHHKMKALGEEAGVGYWRTLLNGPGKMVTCDLHWGNLCHIFQWDGGIIVWRQENEHPTPSFIQLICIQNRDASNFGVVLAEVTENLSRVLHNFLSACHLSTESPFYPAAAGRCTAHTAHHTVDRPDQYLSNT